jgi:Restriction endonuclease
MASLKSALLSLEPSGPHGFEGLIQQLLSALTGYQFYLAQSGTQGGRDLATPRVGTVLAVECKRYGADTELDRTHLLGKLIEAEMLVSGLDVWVLVASRDVPEQLYSALEAASRRLAVDVQVVADGDGTPPARLKPFALTRPR